MIGGRAEHGSDEPARLAPPGSCDCHIHVFGDPAAYPIVPGLRYDPPDATIDKAIRMHDRLGIDRAVIAQTTAYGSDHRLLIDLLTELPSSRYRGIALLDDDVSDADIARMHEAGVRGTRFNLVPGFPSRPSPAEIRRTLDRIRDYSWIARFHVDGEALLAHRDLLLEIEGPAVLDHLGRPDFSLGIEQPATRFAVDLLGNRPNWWVQLSFGHKAGPPPWDASIPFARAFYEAAPDRALWASDWPHIGAVTARPPKQPPDDADILGLLGRQLPGRDAWTGVLVDNPARLFGFTTSERDEAP